MFFRQYEFNYSPPDDPRTGPQLKRLGWRDARDEILATRPYIAWMRPTPPASPHTLVIHGFIKDSGDVRKLKVIDPQENPPDRLLATLGL